MSWAQKGPGRPAGPRQERACLYLYLFLCIYIYTCVYVYMYIYIYFFLRIYIHILICIYIYICVYVRTYVGTYVRTYIVMYVYMCIHANTCDAYECIHPQALSLEVSGKVVLESKPSVRIFGTFLITTPSAVNEKQLC